MRRRSPNSRLPVSPHFDVRDVNRPREVVPVAPWPTPHILTRLPKAAPPPYSPSPPCENLLLGAPFNGEALVWEKVAKSWEKEALSRWGREGVNHEWTCL